jgi:hypothetical protein
MVMWCAELAPFLQERNIDSRVITFMTQELLIQSVADFANFWTRTEYEQGLKEDVVANVQPFAADLSTPAARLQMARLCDAWRMSQDEVEDVSVVLLPKVPDVDFWQQPPGQKQGAAAKEATTIMGSDKAEAAIAKEPQQVLYEVPPQLQSQAQGGTTVGLGMTSEPFTEFSKDDVWNAMLQAVRNPEQSGMKVENVCMSDHPGFMQCTMRDLENPDCPMVIGNVRIDKDSLEITSRSVIEGKECGVERVFALHSDTLRCEIFSRFVKDGKRVEWGAPRTVVNEVFKAVQTLAKKNSTSPKEGGGEAIPDSTAPAQAGASTPTGGCFAWCCSGI